MTKEEIKAVVLEALTSVAPDVNPAGIKPDVNFRDQFDFDSMDFLNFVTALHKKLGVDVPEVDYPKLANLKGCIEYLSRKPASAPAR
jgi:acyl carrier protein